MKHLRVYVGRSILLNLKGEQATEAVSGTLDAIRGEHLVLVNAVEIHRDGSRADLRGEVGVPDHSILSWQVI